MAIEKRFIHFKKFSDFNSKKLSANEANTQYTVGISGEIQTGSPDVLYQSYVWIKDTQQQWTHGQIYNGSASLANEIDPIFSASPAANITEAKIKTWDDTHEFVQELNEDISQLYNDLNAKQDTISDLATIRSGASKGATALQSVPSNYVTERMLQERHYATTKELESKQDVISDLDAIREGASKGATALQSVPSEYVTETELKNKGYATAQEVAQKQDVISDLGTIRSGASKGATAVQPNDIKDFVTEGDLEDVALTGSYNDLNDTPTFKTINGESIVGEGNIEIDGGIEDLKPLITDFSIADISAYVDRGTNFNYDSYSILNALQNKQPIYIPYENDGLEGYYAAYGFVDDYIYLDVLCGEFLYYIELDYQGGGGIANIDVRNLDDFATEGDLAAVAFTADYNDLNNKPTIPSEVTESTVSGWGFTKNTGTISEIRINGSTITRQTNGLMDIGSYQVPLVSGTNIVTARGNSILQQGDLFNTTIISSDVLEILPVSTGNCYIYSTKQTTPKTFNLMWSGNIYNDTITIIIITSSTITFTTSSTYPILWANGNIPAFEAGTLYEISFRQSAEGWMGVAVPFTSVK